MATKTKEKNALQNTSFPMPEGRLINGSLFVRSVYTDEKTGKEGAPMYKAEMGYEQEALRDFEDRLYDCLVEEFGAEAIKEADEEDRIRWPIKDGDKLKKNREKKGKVGDAYEGLDVVRASSKFNRDGDDAEGGIMVYDEDVEEIAPVNKSQVYNGCYGVLAVKAKAYEKTNDDGDTIYSCTLYIVAFHKTRDGERLTAQADHSSLFEKANKDKGGKASGRRARRD